jgi:Protein kinase domain
MLFPATQATPSAAGSAFLLVLLTTAAASSNGQTLNGCESCGSCLLGLWSHTPTGVGGKSFVQSITRSGADDHETSDELGKPGGDHDRVLTDFESSAEPFDGRTAYVGVPPYLASGTIGNPQPRRADFDGLARCGDTGVWFTTFQRSYSNRTFPSPFISPAPVDVVRDLYFAVVDDGGAPPSEGDMSDWFKVTSMPQVNAGPLQLDVNAQSDPLANFYTHAVGCTRNSPGEVHVVLIQGSVFTSGGNGPASGGGTSRFRLVELFGTRDGLVGKQTFDSGKATPFPPEAVGDVEAGFVSCAAVDRWQQDGQNHEAVFGFLHGAGVFALLREDDSDSLSWKLNRDDRWKETQCAGLWLEKPVASTRAEDLFVVSYRPADHQYAKFSGPHKVGDGGEVAYADHEANFPIFQNGQLTLVGVSSACDSLHWGWIAGAIALAFLLLCVVPGIALFFLWRRRKNKQQGADDDAETTDMESSSNSMEQLTQQKKTKEKKKKPDSSRSSTGSKDESPRRGGSRGGVASGSEEMLKIIEDVEVGRVIGAGSFGDVHRGSWQGTTDVALKKLKGGPLELKEFATEAKTLQKLDHPRIVRFFGVYAERDADAPSSDSSGCSDVDVEEFAGLSFSPHTTFFMVTEFMSAGGVNSLLQKEQDDVTVDQLVRMALDTSAGMKYLSSLGIVHRGKASFTQVLLYRAFCMELC